MTWPVNVPWLEYGILVLCARTGKRYSQCKPQVADYISLKIAFKAEHLLNMIESWSLKKGCSLREFDTIICLLTCNFRAIAHCAAVRVYHFTLYKKIYWVNPILEKGAVTAISWHAWYDIEHECKDQSFALPTQCLLFASLDFRSILLRRLKSWVRNPKPHVACHFGFLVILTSDQKTALNYASRC